MSTKIFCDIADLITIKKFNKKKIVKCSNIVSYFKNTIDENFKEKKRGAIKLGTKQKKVYFGKGSKSGKKYTGTSEF